MIVSKTIKTNFFAHHIIIRILIFVFSFVSHSFNLHKFGVSSKSTFETKNNTDTLINWGQIYEEIDETDRLISMLSKMNDMHRLWHVGHYIQVWSNMDICQLQTGCVCLSVCVNKHFQSIQNLTSYF